MSQDTPSSSSIIPLSVELESSWNGKINEGLFFCALRSIFFKKPYKSSLKKSFVGSNYKIKFEKIKGVSKHEGKEFFKNRTPDDGIVYSSANSNIGRSPDPEENIVRNSKG